jgi:hypothetical protein
MQMTVGVMLGMIVVRRAVIWLENTVIATGKPENKDARSAIMQQVLHGFFDISLWVLWIAFAILVVAAVTGPYRWAVRTREWSRNVAAWTSVGLGRGRGATAGNWIPTPRRAAYRQCRTRPGPTSRLRALLDRPHRDPRAAGGLRILAVAHRIGHTPADSHTALGVPRA